MSEPKLIDRSKSTRKRVLGLQRAYLDGNAKFDVETLRVTGCGAALLRPPLSI
jgi:hypothetical protein